MPQEQKPAPPKQRKLTPEELARFVGGKFTPSQLQLIWTKKMPVNANQDDFELFLYACEAKDLDPLLSEVYCRLQWEKDLGEWKLLILDSIHGMLKSADKTNEINGIETTIEVNDQGQIVSATATVHRKGCEFPFKATAYWEEYNANTFIWRQKPRVMITKCATALALRLAFASALAGIYVAEEFDKSDAAPTEPNSEFVIERLASDVSLAQKSTMPASEIHPDDAASYDSSDKAKQPLEVSNNPDGGHELSLPRSPYMAASTASSTAAVDISDFAPSSGVDPSSLSSRQHTAAFEEASGTLGTPGAHDVSQSDIRGQKAARETVTRTQSPIQYTKKEAEYAPAMPINLTEVKQTNSALVQRLMLDLQIDKTMRQPLLTAYYQGYLGVTEMPKDATVFTPALRALSAFSDSTRAARIEFVADAKGLGQRLRSDKEHENAQRL